MTRLIIHAGFHKTGTTTVQTTLHTNRRKLRRHARILLKPDFPALTDAARRFSVDPHATTLADVASEAVAFFATLATDDPRPLVMSSEDLSGHMPGRHGLDQYDAAPLIMSQLAEAARAHFGDDLDLVFFFSTRERTAWLRSTWWQNLRSTRLDQDFDVYSDAIAAAADLPQVLSEIAEAVAPAVVSALPLEESTDMPQGPMTPLLDLIDLPEDQRTKLSILPPENVQPDLGLESVFLALNRSGFRDRYLNETKKLLRQMANRQLDRD
ncbi:MAG: hypothetical protein QNJ09_11340 [Paracoccaceae bacterium]|nr:hypothetical protein [Paracoccaceae bacterium]